MTSTSWAGACLDLRPGPRVAAHIFVAVEVDAPDPDCSGIFALPFTLPVWGPFFCRSHWWSGLLFHCSLAGPPLSPGPPSRASFHRSPTPLRFQGPHSRSSFLHCCSPPVPLDSLTTFCGGPHFCLPAASAGPPLLRPTPLLRSASAAARQAPAVQWRVEGGHPLSRTGSRTEWRGLPRHPGRR